MSAIEEAEPHQAGSLSKETREKIEQLFRDFSEDLEIIFDNLVSLYAPESRVDDFLSWFPYCESGLVIDRDRIIFPFNGVTVSFRIVRKKGKMVWRCHKIDFSYPKSGSLYKVYILIRRGMIDNINVRLKHTYEAALNDYMGSS